MKIFKIALINITILFFLILILFLVMGVLNMKYKGTPIYGKLGINLEDLKSYHYQNKIRHVELNYTDYFSKYTAEEYLEN